MPNICEDAIKRKRMSDKAVSVINTLASDKNVKARLSRLLSLRTLLNSAINDTLKELNNE